MTESLANAIKDVVSKNNISLPKMPASDAVNKKLDSVADAFLPGTKLSQQFSQLNNTITQHLKSALPGNAPKPAPTEANENRAGNTPSFTR